MKLTPKSLAIFAVTGVVATASLSASGAIRAEHICNQFPEGIDNIEKVKATWSCWLPPFLVASGTIAAIIAGDRMSASRLAAVSAAGTQAAGYLAEYKDQVRKVLKKEDAEQIDRSISERHRPEIPKGIVPVVGEGGTLVYDSLSGRYFASDMEEVRKCMNDFNYSLLGGVFLSVNDWYSHLGLPPVELGNDLGWKPERPLDIYFDSIIVSGQPLLTVDYIVMPEQEKK